MKQEYDILIIEDDEVVNKSAKMILATEGFNVDSVYNSNDAKTRLEDCSYKIVITDLMLPERSGMELLKIVKEKAPHIPVIMISGYATLNNAVESFKQGTFDFIPKPFTYDELLSVVYRAVRFLKAYGSAGGDMSRFISADVPDISGYYFLGDHSWCSFNDDGSVVFGAGIAFSNTMADIKHIEFPEIGSDIIQGNMFVQIYTEDSLVHRVWAPLSGKVLKCNMELLSLKYLLKKDPFMKGWLAKIKPAGVEKELVNLMPLIRQQDI